MPRAFVKDRQERAVLLSRLPEGATRVKVENEIGKTCYKEIDNLADTDKILTKDDGTPIVMFASPGRKRHVVLEPVNSTVKEILKRKEAFVQKDPLCQITHQDPESPDVLQHVMVGISEEAASIAFERQEAERQGKDTATLSQRRIQAMRAVGEAWLKRKEQVSARGIDLDSPAFESVFAYTMETFKEAMTSAKARPEMIETVFAKFAQMINDEWKAEAKTRMKKLV
jgi:hypothetical protein